MRATTTKSGQKAAMAVQEIYRPVLRGYFALFGVYYAVMFCTHFVYFEGLALFAMGGVAGVAAAAAGYGVWQLRQKIETLHLELLLTALNMLVLANILVALNLQFDSAKLVYFVIIAVGFAVASASLRQSVISLSAAAVALVSFAPFLDAQTFQMYAFLVFGAAVASLGIALLIRTAMTSIADAKIQVEDELDEARELGKMLEKRSLSDSLTGLPNRRAFFGRLRAAMADIAEKGVDHCPNGVGWLLLIDLDGFKAVNDVHGHLTGDLLLKQVADRLNLLNSSDAMVCRMGGDEFNILVTYQDCNVAMMQRCDLILSALAAPYLIEERQIRISASIGVKRLAAEPSMSEQINQTDFALMSAKRKGRNQAVLFNGELAKQAEARSKIEHALRRADLASEIDLLFQPQFDLQTNRILRAEVLARWESATLGPIDPDSFIRIAEESGLITNITLTVIEKTFREINRWPVDLPVSINLSSHDIISKPTIEKIIQLAEECGIDPCRVEFEVTETAMMADVDKAIRHLELLGKIGFSIALDDFGTGYSNFSYLRSLPIGKLKVDRSFIEDPGDPMTEKILSSLTGMARVLGVHCLLEGVEDEVGLLMAKRAGAHSVQGYLFGKPMSAEKIIRKATQQNDAHRSGEDTAPVPVLSAR